MSLLILTGASGAGKTAIAEAVAARQVPGVEVFFFDSVGVPTLERMIADFGTAVEWQRATTIAWVRWLLPLVAAGRAVLLEGQMRIAFVEEAVALANMTDYSVILVDCNDEVRRRRLTIERGQPNLASPTMMNWARHLRDEARTGSRDILDTSAMPLAEASEFIRRRLLGIPD